jgi:hypothetical protein
MRLWIPLWVAVLTSVSGTARAQQPSKQDPPAAPATEKKSPAPTDPKPAADKPQAAPQQPAAATTTPPGPTAAPPAPAPKTAGAPPATAGSEAPIDGATYVVRLRDLEQRIDELKEQIRRSHTRLSLLSDTILAGGVGGARAEIRFKNDMSSAFRLTRALFVLDGAVQYNKQDDTGALAAQKEIPIFTGSIPPGDHTLQVLIQLRGHGYGVFSYLRGYRFEVKSDHSFTITEGKTIELEAIAFEKGGVTTPLEQRPTVRYVQNVKSGIQAGDGTPGPAGSGSRTGSGGSSSIGTGGR